MAFMLSRSDCPHGRDDFSANGGLFGIRFSPLVLPATEPAHCPATFELETDLEPMAESEEQASPCRTATPSPVLGKALVKGLCDNQRMQWEVSFELEPPALQRGDTQNADMWSETFHHLAARAIIREFEHLAEREDEIELGERPGLGLGVFPFPQPKTNAALFQSPAHILRPAPPEA